MQAQFKVNITVKDMYTFLINNTYRKFTGVVWVVFSLVVIGVTIFTWGDIKLANSILLIVLASMYTIINPIILWLKANAQIKNNDYFNNTLDYTADAKGIKVSQSEESTTIKWEEMWKAVKYGGIVVVYVSTIRAFILPIRCMGDQYNNFVEMAAQGLGTKCHLRKK